MAKKTTLSKKIETVISKKPAAKAVSSPVRNSAIPKAAPVAARKAVAISTDMIAKKAYEIFASGKGGSELDNWFAAERELRQGV